MNQLVPLAAQAAPALAARERAQVRFLEFFTANIRNRNTRRAYAQAVREFMAWCGNVGIQTIADVQPVHVAQLGQERAAPTVKQRLAAIRHLFDWLVTGQVIPVNPASSVRGPRHVVKKGKTPVLSPKEARRVLDVIDVATPAGQRDRALIGLMMYSFARIGAALAMKVEDVYVQDRRLWVRLREKGGKRHEMPCHRMSLISAITARGLMRFMIKEKGGVNAAVFIEFLKRLMAGAQRAIFLIVDRGPAHIAKKTRAFVDSQHGRLRLVQIRGLELPCSFGDTYTTEGFHARGKTQSAGVSQVAE